MDEPQQTPWLTIEIEGSLYRPKLDVPKMGLALFHAAKNVASGTWGGLAADGEEAFKALGLKPEPAALAGFLLQRAIIHAFRQIVDENRYRYGEELPDEKQTLVYFARAYSGRTTTPLNKDFFQRPHQLPFIVEVARPFQEWLAACGVPPVEAQRLAEIRFPLMVLYALSDEWRKNAEFYKPILTAAETPFQPAAEREYDWTRYRFHLQTQFSAAPLFDEDFALESVYVPLRAYLETRSETERTAYVRDTQRIRHVTDLHTTMFAWLHPRQAASPTRTHNSVPGRLPPETPLCVLSGGPGSGKSSFCKQLAARLAQEGRHVLLIPMHHFTLKGDIPTSVDDCISERLGFLSHKPLQNCRVLASRPGIHPPLILIFDGLDELASQGRASQEAARTFLSALKDFLRDENAADLRVQAIISGRELVIQTHDTDLIGRPLLHLLPYVLTPEEITPPPHVSRSYTYSDPGEPSAGGSARYLVESLYQRQKQPSESHARVTQT